jgi:hypothetical protein
VTPVLNRWLDLAGQDFAVAISRLFMSRFMLEIFFEYNSTYSIVAPAKLLLSYIDAHGADSFEKFVSYFHAMKKSVY